MNILRCHRQLLLSRPPILWASLALMVLALNGCVAPGVSEAEWERRTMKLLQARKKSSQAGLVHDRIGASAADSYVNVRTPLLLGGEGTVTTRIEDQGRTAVIGWQSTPGQAVGGVSSAAAISEDGYYLTAAHAVSDSSMHLVRTSGRGPDVARVRVVWKGDPAHGGPDLALIHAAVRHQPFFPLLDAGAAPTRARVWTAGFGNVRQNQTRGWLRSVGPWQQGADGSVWRTLEHTAPLMRGDSGGPLVGRDGRLLGINTEFLVQPASVLGVDHLRVYRPLAIGVDTAWIEHRMAKDRATRRAAVRSSPRGRP